MLHGEPAGVKPSRAEPFRRANADAGQRRRFFPLPASLSPSRCELWGPWSDDCQEVPALSRQLLALFVAGPLCVVACDYERFEAIPDGGALGSANASGAEPSPPEASVPAHPEGSSEITAPGASSTAGPAEPSASAPIDVAPPVPVPPEMTTEPVPSTPPLGEPDTVPETQPPLEPSCGLGACDAGDGTAVDDVSTTVEPSAPDAAKLDLPDAASGSLLDAAAPQPDPEPDGDCWPEGATLCAPCLEIPGCELLDSHLLHRYSFSGEGQIAVDSVGGADGEIVGAELDGSAALELSGMGQYVELPSGVLGNAPAVSVEVWMQWHGGEAGQRIFDFGNSILNQRQTYVFVTPRGGADVNSALALSYATAGFNQAERSAGLSALGTGWSHVVTVLDGDEERALLYVDGDLQLDADFDAELSEIVDTQNFIGRSLLNGDPDLDATLDEFRIYDVALGADDIARSFELGPDTPMPSARN
jgi:Concanavalin A-like lectin/glucanases superfamily